MKKQIVKTISILSLLAALSTGTVSIYAGGGDPGSPPRRPSAAYTQASLTLADLIEQWTISFMSYISGDKTVDEQIITMNGPSTRPRCTGRCYTD